MYLVKKYFPDPFDKVIYANFPFLEDEWEKGGLLSLAWRPQKMHLECFQKKKSFSCKAYHYLFVVKCTLNRTKVGIYI